MRLHCLLSFTLSLAPKWLTFLHSNNLLHHPSNFSLVYYLPACYPSHTLDIFYISTKSTLFFNQIITAIHAFKYLSLESFSAFSTNVKPPLLVCGFVKVLFWKGRWGNQSHASFANFFAFYTLQVYNRSILSDQQ